MDQLKRLFVNGCSFLTHRHTDEANINFSTAELIKEHGGFEEMVNFARGGRGNDRILSTTITYFEKYPEYKRNTFVLIGWSSALRLDYPTAIEFKPLPPLDECWATIKMLMRTGFTKVVCVKCVLGEYCFHFTSTVTSPTLTPRYI